MYGAMAAARAMRIAGVTAALVAAVAVGRGRVGTAGVLLAGAVFVGVVGAALMSKFANSFVSGPGDSAGFDARTLWPASA